ncbi:YoaK family protein [Sphingopyxis sp. KK2]|uniref:YoaK family protein n=1 Tax=Sphingopyxis sp. KK2 TaxID=1855727 RepID=UPI00097E7323|nr:YoaK family protein [Sphingopyxis sp. KK2]
MIRFERSHQHLAVGIATLAGFVDAIGFVESAGFFVSFMTGNSTRLAVGLAQWQGAAAIAGGIIIMFVAGVVAGALVAARSGPRQSRIVLASVAVLLAAAIGLRLALPGWPPVLCLAFAMGAVNAALPARNGTIVGVTYMTGTLVQLGHKIANALRGGDDGRWLGHLLLWGALVAGAIVGARTVLWSAPAAYGLAAAFAAALAWRAGKVAHAG